MTVTAHEQIAMPPPVIATEAKQSIYPRAEIWIASSLRSSQ